MYVRCPDCKASTWVAGPGGDPATAFACKRCAASHELSRIDELGATQEDRHARAVGFADRHGVDLASAYSMLLGLMPEPREREPVATEAPGDLADDTADHPGGDDIHFDPGFGQAVDEGLLTRAEARALGDRESAALRLARRHQLPLELALNVVDRRIPLSEAIQQAPRIPVVTPAVSASRPQQFMVAGLGGLALVALVTFGGSRWASLESQARMAEAHSAETSAAPLAAGVGFAGELTTPPEAAMVAEHATDRADHGVQTDGEGRVLKITARSPRAVLEAFCSSGFDAGRYRPDEVVPATHGARLGVLRDLDDLENPLAILIRRDRGSGRWTAGNGLEPIVVAAHPD